MVRLLCITKKEKMVTLSMGYASVLRHTVISVKKICIFELIKVCLICMISLHRIHLSMPHVYIKANKLCFNYLSLHNNLQI